MDLASHLLALVAPFGIGDEVVAGARLVSVSTELGLRLRFAYEGSTIDVELTPSTDAVAHAARTSAWLLAYRVDADRHAPKGAMELCEAVASIVARNEASVLDALRRDTAAHSGTAETRIREVVVDRLLEDARGFYTLSPYVGCLVGCRFCYAQSRIASVRRLVGLQPVPWGSFVDVRIDAPRVLERELGALPPRPIKFCPIVSDPYQAVERRYRLTRGCLEVLADHGDRFPVLLLTRSAVIEDDIDRLGALPHAYVGVSIPTIDDTVRAHFEPRAAPVERRLEILDALRRTGVTTIAVVQPMLPGSVDALADALAPRVDSVSIDVLRGVEGAAADFADPRYLHSRDDAWQRDRAEALAATLRARGIEVWSGELPPDLAQTEEPGS